MRCCSVAWNSFYLVVQPGYIVYPLVQPGWIVYPVVQPGCLVYPVVQPGWIVLSCGATGVFCFYLVIQLGCVVLS